MRFRETHNNASLGQFFRGRFSCFGEMFGLEYKRKLLKLRLLCSGKRKLIWGHCCFERLTRHTDILQSAKREAWFIRNHKKDDLDVLQDIAICTNYAKATANHKADQQLQMAA